jgi:dethiobiotin synthetase
VSHPTLPTLFFAGTDTDVGKTYTAALAAAELTRAGKRVGVYKPVASGCRSVEGAPVADDAVALWEAAGRPRTLDEVCPQRFLQPLAPPQAAANEGKTVDAEQLRSGAVCWEGDAEVLIVEGAGGLLSPLADGVLNIDLYKRFESAMLLIVAANRLGAIHQTLATCAAASHLGVEPRGVILCDPTGEAAGAAWNNAAEITRYCEVPLLGSVPYASEPADVSFIHKLLG